MIPGWLAGYAPDGSPWRPRGSWAAYASHIGGYMHRWILLTPWGCLRIHRILRADAGRDHHDHPFDFSSLILWGGYVEERPDGVTVARRGDVVRRLATDLHRIVYVLRGTTTLVLASPRLRTWGFATDAGWVSHTDYRGEA